MRKVILVGNGSAGKSSLIARFVDDGVDRQYRQTIGVDFFEKIVELRHKLVRLQIWDVGGQNAGSKMLSKYVFGSNIIVLCYDITDLGSFHDLDGWIKMIRKVQTPQTGLVLSCEPERKKPLVFLMGNKKDLLQFA